MTDARNERLSHPGSMLYLVATPIGNLKDITYRAVEVLSSADYILCEDTKHSLSLLNHYQIKKPLYSYHKFNEAKQTQKIIEDLKNGLIVALISDAGTPGICDPGQRLVAECAKENLSYSVIPGACALVSALTLSGKGEEKFQFIGFWPKKESVDVLNYPGITICYETPHRLVKTLAHLCGLDKDLPLCVIREITKLHEECKHGTAEELLAYYTEHPPRGEIVLLISGKQKQIDYSHITIEEHVQSLEKTGLSQKAAIKLAATLRNVSKRNVYNTIHQKLKVE